MTESSLPALIVSCHTAEPALISLPQSARVWGLCSGFLFGAFVKGYPELVSGSGFWRNRGWGSRFVVGKARETD